MNHRRAIAVLTLVVALVASACSSSSLGTGTTAAGAAATTTSVGSSGTDTTTPEITETTTVASESVFTGADPIEQLTPTSGGGTRPLLEWEAVDGAALYFVTVYTETGESYWAAVTAETETYVGGPLQIPAGRTGPNVADGYTWTVVAEDADGNLLAASTSRAIAP